MEPKDLEDILKKAGISSTVYQDTGFFMERNDNGSSIEIGLPKENDISIKTENKQAVINITEPERVFEDCVYISGKNYAEDFKNYSGTAAQFIKKHKLRKTIDRKRISAINSTFKIKKVEPVGTGVYVDIKITAPEQKNCFLIGIDENHHFISQLKNPVNTVKQAHKELRPKGLKPGTFRIGEFFYEPVNKSQSKQLNKYRNIIDSEEGIKSSSEKLPRKTDFEFGSNFPFEDNDNHCASCWIRLMSGDDDEIYAIGYLTDDRGFHKEKYIEDWHRVVHNNEEINTSEAWD